MRRRSAISGPGSDGGLSWRSISLTRVSSSSTLPPSASTSPARATPPTNNPQIRIWKRMLLLGLRLGLVVLVLDDVLAVAHVEAVFHVGGHDVPLLVAHHLELELLALGGGEGPAGVDVEPVPLE